MHQTYCLDCHQMRLCFEENPQGCGYGYQLLVNDSAGWRPISSPGNPLVRGKTFNLLPAEIRYDHNCQALVASGISHATNVLGDLILYPWTARIEADLSRNWFEFTVEVNSPAELQLSMQDGLEPEIMLDLGHLPPYERGEHVWVKTNIDNPTQWDGEARGNDFPATYYFDPYKHMEVMMFFDMTAMSWMGYSNIARFLNYRCGLRRYFHPAPAAEIGLYADGFSGKIFPAGPQYFHYWLTANPRGDGKDAPHEKEAVHLLVERCLDLLPRKSNWPLNATSWEDFSLHCAVDMSDNEHSWASDENGEFIFNYVDGYSPAWKAALEARGGVYKVKTPCLETAIFAANPLSVICATEPTPEYHALQKRLLDFTERAWRANYANQLNGRTKEFSMAGTWQYIYILEELWQVAVFNKDEEAKCAVEREVDTTLIPFARQVCHIFPLLFNKQTMEKVYSGDNHGVAGLYAYFMVHLYQTSGKKGYLDEAIQALRVNYQLPTNMVLQEVFHTAAGVNAAAQLFCLTGESEFKKIYRYLLSQSLRLMYWYDDRTNQEARVVHTMGMFNGCTPMNYTAFFENIATIALIVPTFKWFEPLDGFLNAINIARKNNFYFFPQCLPEKYHLSPLNYIPHENIPLLEGPQELVGQELYGAGFTFRAYLLWEAFGRSSNRDVMVLNLDGFEESSWLEAPSYDLTFLVYNPEETQQSTCIVFPRIENCQVSVNSGPNLTELQQDHRFMNARLDLDLTAFEKMYIKLHVIHSMAGRD